MQKAAFLIIGLLLRCAHASPNVIYVAVEGNDKNPGTEAQPLATIQRAQDKAHPGDTVYIRGGVYHIAPDQIAQHERNYACITFLDKSGRSGGYINYWAYPGETPVFDCSAVKPDGYRVAAFYVTGSWLHLKGFEVTGVQVTIKTHTQSECFENHGSHNIYERLSMHDGMAIGFYLLQGSDNLVLNCDAYRNFDYFSENGRGGNTDGFGCHPDAGSTGNVFRGCRSWFNSDDGYDCINAHESTVFDHCWAFYNGYTPDFTSEGDGNGFKAGGYARRPIDQVPIPVPQNTVEFCVAVRNKASGFYANHHLNGNFWYNNSAYRNYVDYNMLNRLADPYSDVPGYKHVLRNNLGFGGEREVANLDTAQCVLSGNFFGPGPGPGVSDSDFISLDETQLTAPRQPDGSLPVITFLHLRPTSRLFGKDVGAFAGAPASAFSSFPAPFAHLVFSDDFTRPLDRRTWVPEIEPKPGADSKVYTRSGALIPDTPSSSTRPSSSTGALILDTRGGVTVWLNRLLTGDIRIEFDRAVLVDSGPNDRLSDMNVFWMASDPENPNLFTRNGKLEAYNDLRLYYVGMGGNTNKTTRFRKYSGGERTLLGGFTDSAHLLQANKIYHISIIVHGGATSFSVDGNRFFTYADPDPLTSGYFGFRSTWSRQAITHFRLYTLSGPVMQVWNPRCKDHLYAVMQN